MRLGFAWHSILTGGNNIVMRGHSREEARCRVLECQERCRRYCEAGGVSACGRRGLLWRRSFCYSQAQAHQSFLLRGRWWTCPEQDWSGLSLVLLCAVTVWALIGFWSTFHHACKGYLKAKALFTMCFDFNNSRILDFQETVYSTCLGK